MNAATEGRFLPLLRFQMSKFSAGSLNLAEIECFRNEDWFKTRFHAIIKMQFSVCIKIVYVFRSYVRYLGAMLMAPAFPAAGAPKTRHLHPPMGR